MDLSKFQAIKEAFPEVLNYVLMSRDGTVVQTSFNTDALNIPLIGSNIANIIKDIKKLIEESLKESDIFIKYYLETLKYFILFLRLDTDAVIVLFFSKENVKNKVKLIGDILRKIDTIMGNIEIKPT